MLASSARDLPPATVMFVLLTVLSLFLAIAIWFSPSPQRPNTRVLAAPVQLESEPQIRVRVLRRVAQASVSASSTLIFEDHTGQTTQIASPVTISINAGVFSITTGDGAVLDDFSDQPFTIHADLFEIDSVTVEGELSVSLAINAPDLLDLIVAMPIERYLPGVLAGELLSGWPPGVFRAQAVAARSYALHERSLALTNGRAWDVERSTRSQSFVGQTSLQVALDAAADTRGQVLRTGIENGSGGDLLRAYYSSSIGGRAASAADVFRSGPGFEFNLAAPLQASHREYFDDDSPTHRWVRTRDIADLSSRIRGWAANRNHAAKKLGLLVSVTATAHNAVDRPTVFTLTDSAGESATLTAEQLRVACNYTSDRFASLEFKSRVLSGDLEMEFDGPIATIRGRGFGHGVGMCQYSAAHLAELGEHYTKILQRYYPDAQIVRWYD